LKAIHDSDKFIRSAVESYVASNSVNRLKAFDDALIFESRW